MYCNNCGQELKDGARFCSKCGNRVSIGIRQPEQDSKPVKKGHGKLILIGILVFVLTGLGAGGFYVYKTRFASLYLAAVQNEEGKWGYIDKSGKEVIECQFYVANTFSENGLAVVKKNTSKREGDKWGVIDAKGKEIIPCIYDGILSSDIENAFDNKGLLQVGMKYNVDEERDSIIRWGFINENGEEVISPQYNYIKENGWDNNGLRLVEKADGKYVFIDEQGEEKIMAAEEMSVFEDSPWPYLAKDVAERELYAIKRSCGVDENGDTVYKWGFADENNQVKIECQFDGCGSFSGQGLAPVARQKGIDQNGYPILEWGYVNTKGEIVIPFQFENAEEFGENEVAPIKTFDGISGYINKTGEWVISLPKEIDYAYQFRGNVAMVCAGDEIKYEDSKDGLINLDGEFLLPCAYENIAIYENAESIIVSEEVGENDEKEGYVDEKGEFIVPVSYDYAKPFGKDGWAAVGIGADDKYKCEYIDKTGNTVLELPTKYIRAYSFVKVR